MRALVGYALQLGLCVCARTPPTQCIPDTTENASSYGAPQHAVASKGDEIDTGVEQLLRWTRSTTADEQLPEGIAGAEGHSRARPLSEYSFDEEDAELESLHPPPIRDYFIPGDAASTPAVIVSPWRELPAVAARLGPGDEHDQTRRAISACFDGLKDGIRGFVQQHSPYADKYAPGSDWWPRMYGDKDYQDQMADGLVNNFVPAIQTIMALAETLPDYAHMAPGVPEDRRFAKSSRITVATFNCEFLDLNGTAKFRGDATRAHHFYHALVVAQTLDAVGADVVVLQEVQNWGAAELVRLLMGRGDEYRAYCTERHDARRGFRPVLLTRIDPVEPLGWLNSAETADVRHFVARLGVWTAVDRHSVWPVDVIGLHLPCYAKKQKNEEKGRAVRDAIVNRHFDARRHGDDAPLLVAGDVNSRPVDVAFDSATNPQRERRTALYALHAGTGLVSCMTDAAPATTRKHRSAIDHVLVPVEAVYPEYSVYAQLETRVCEDGAGYALPAWRSDHFPVRIALQLGHEVPGGPPRWVRLTPAGRQWRLRHSDEALPRSVLSRSVSANAALLRTWSQEKLVRASRSGEGAGRPSSRLGVSPELFAGRGGKASVAPVSVLRGRGMWHPPVVSSGRRRVESSGHADVGGMVTAGASIPPDGVSSGGKWSGDEATESDSLTTTAGSTSNALPEPEGRAVHTIAPDWLRRTHPGLLLVEESDEDA